MSVTIATIQHVFHYILKVNIELMCMLNISLLFFILDIYIRNYNNYIIWFLEYHTFNVYNQLYINRLTLFKQTLSDAMLVIHRIQYFPWLVVLH